MGWQDFLVGQVRGGVELRPYVVLGSDWLERREDQFMGSDRIKQRRQDQLMGPDSFKQRREDQLMGQDLVLGLNISLGVTTATSLKS